MIQEEEQAPAHIVQQQQQQQQQQQFTLNSALDGNVVSSLLSMKSTELITLLRSLENNNEPVVSDDPKVPKDVNVHDLIDKKNSNSFAKLFSMKNADFKALLENQTTAPQNVVKHAHNVIPQKSSPHPSSSSQIQGGSGNNLFSSMAGCHSLKPPLVPAADGTNSSSRLPLSRMRSGDLVDWIWSLEEDNLDAILSETEQLKQKAGLNSTPRSSVPSLAAGQQAAPVVVQDNRSHTYENLMKEGLAPGHQTQLQRKLSDVYFGLDGTSEISRETPLGTNQLALLLQHQAFLVKRQEEQNAAAAQYRRDPQSQATSSALTDVQHDESISNKTALELFEEIIEEQQDINHPHRIHDQMNKPENNAAKPDGLVGSLTMALGHKSHSSLYVQNGGDTPTPGGSKKRKKGGAGSRGDESDNEYDDFEEDEQLDGEDIQRLKKKNERRLKNKESAARSRMKKKTYTQSLEKVVETLKEENAELNKKYADLISKRQRAETRDVQSRGESKTAKHGNGDDDNDSKLSAKRHQLFQLYSLPINFKL